MLGVSGATNPVAIISVTVTDSICAGGVCIKPLHTPSPCASISGTGLSIEVSISIRLTGIVPIVSIVNSPPVVAW